MAFVKINFISINSKDIDLLNHKEKLFQKIFLIILIESLLILALSSPKVLTYKIPFLVIL